MGRKKQEMVQVYNGSKNEFIFGEEGGRGKNLSSFLRNLSLTGSSKSSSGTSQRSIDEANSNIYGSLSYNKQLGNSNPSLTSGSVLTPRPSSSRAVSSSAINLSQNMMFNSDMDKASKSSNSHHHHYHHHHHHNHQRVHSMYKDLDDDWNAEIEEEIARGRGGGGGGGGVTSSGMNELYSDISTLSQQQHSHNPPRKESMELREELPKKSSGTESQGHSKLAKFKSVLTCDNVINIQELRKLSWNGIPNELRALSWLLLLGYLPTNRSRQSSTLKRKRQEYLDGIASVQINFDGEADSNVSSSTFNGSRENQLYHQIRIDVKRTNPNSKLYAHPITQTSLQKILYLWAIRHPASGYVQGINDLATPFYQIFLSNYIWQLQEWKQKKHKENEFLFIPGYMTSDDANEVIDSEQKLFEDTRLLDYNLNNFDPSLLSSRVISIIEADTYWCLSRLLENITDNYIHEQPGILRQVGELKTLISKIDNDLILHFEKEGVEFLQFAFRWMNCLLMRELPIELIIRMWDTYLSEQPLGFNTFHTYVCAAFLIKFSSELKQKDFQEILLFLQNPPTSNWKEKDIELMLSEAYIWQSLYKNASAHLR
ncbi:GYP1 [Candida oxycetoniae]|uniref:Oxidant-induced cell-cycle arrest protein 5 n=1 Tax=Candida oxycetoniae TaxID=497107 RepID=A0AAI9T1D8_9ASCO|nr:GYP1 [Candida oxycetoniae]KAI3406650.2 GYP1 [Candida oxycetoniae]